MITIKHLEVALDEFLNRHWHPPFSDVYDRPRWSPLWKGKGEMPNRLMPGCYALRSEKGVEYVGSEIRRGKYSCDNGIGGRTNAYYRWSKGENLKNGHRVYRMEDPWVGIYTVGFPPEVGYLTVALEHFLIASLQPLRNKVRMSGGVSDN